MVIHEILYILQSWLILVMSNKLCVHLASHINMACPLVIMEYVAFGFLEMSFILWHCTHYCIAWHLELCRNPMVATVPV